VLFEGTLRSNLDPFDEVSDDAVIWQALRRAWLVGTEDEKCDPERHTLSLESPIESGGNNLSVGERALISLARALIKDSRICVLDEATVSLPNRGGCRAV
jgi:ABC-type multidrug transport system fused ATPase/permease subunit